ncbi:MAG: site-2 protease family protein [Candidatus Omnitrophica bacterium]|nr:site-2 protease family protein [Candidatus Omnitrophota bacterium]
MGLISLLQQDPRAFIILVPVLLYSVIFHEVAHGWVASLFGDETARNSGRLSLLPQSHIDPIGTLALFFVGFGWARPVPVDYRNLGHSRWPIIAVSLAGCVTNILIATLALFLLQFDPVTSSSLLSSVLLIAAQINLILGSFNLIPIPPLDGSRVLIEFLPYRAKYQLARLEPYGFFIIIFLLFLGILDPLIRIIQTVIIFFIGLAFSFFR